MQMTIFSQYSLLVLLLLLLPSTVSSRSVYCSLLQKLGIAGGGVSLLQLWRGWAVSVSAASRCLATILTWHRSPPLLVEFSHHFYTLSIGLCLNDWTCWSLSLFLRTKFPPPPWFTCIKVPPSPEESWNMLNITILYVLHENNIKNLEKFQMPRLLFYSTKEDTQLFCLGQHLLTLFKFISPPTPSTPGHR